MSKPRLILNCPCGYRPPNVDSLEGWAAWYDHLIEVHPDTVGQNRDH